ncbi:hypothetical protein HOH15_07125 [Candidatus Woesearchaeota archaeon]|nr:hypothetical protein [Candidatus Woesearchaeota archaeon]
MKCEETIKKVEESNEFKEFKKQHPNAYLIHVFMMDAANTQVGYYLKENKHIITFEISDAGIRAEEAKPFQKEEHDIVALDLDKIKVDFDEAKEIAVKTKEENYKGEIINKSILILQNISEGQIYNVTFITASFKTLNIKINAETKQIIDHNLATLIGL